MTTNKPTFAEFAIALMAYNVASAQLSHLEDFILERSIMEDHKWQYRTMVRNYVKAYRAYGDVVDRMYA
jgi:hypothetical protein